MRFLIPILLLSIAALGAAEAWGTPESDLVPVTETHAPVEIEFETEARADREVAAFAPRLKRPAALAVDSDDGVSHGVPPTPPPER